MSRKVPVRGEGKVHRNLRADDSLSYRIYDPGDTPAV